MTTTTACAVVCDTAHQHLERGWHILAVQPKGKDPYFRFAPKAYLSATDNHADIDKWFNQQPNLNIGVAARQSGLIILDVDHRNLGKAGEQILAQLAESGALLTHTVTTGDGYHLYYRATGLPPRVPGKLADGIDVKYNGYVVAAPSTHPNGSTYTSNNADPAPLPTWLIGGRP